LLPERIWALHGLSMPIIQWNGMWPFGRFENFKNRSCLNPTFQETGEMALQSSLRALFATRENEL